MKTRFFYGLLALSLVLTPLAIFLIGCGGGGGGTAGGTASDTGAGSVSVLLADGPANDYEAIRVWITEVSLIPYGENKAPVTIFEKPDPGLEINLLDYRDEDFLLTFAENVPAGLYSKIRLRISDIEVEGANAPCSYLELKLPSGKIDLNPREPFRVTPGGKLSIRLDMDANKSILLGQAGRSGRCIFRPIVFVDIETEKAPRRCPAVLSGTIVRLITSTAGTTGFILSLGDCRGEIEVTMLPDTPVFDASAQFSDAAALRAGQDVKVRGRLVDCGVLQASLVVIGQVEYVKGLVDTAYSATTQTFLFTAAIYEGFVGQFEVKVLDQTLVVVDCDTEVSPGDYIRQGAAVRVIGKMVGGAENVLKAAAILVKPPEVLGTVTAVSTSLRGKTLTVQEDGYQTTVFIPAGMPINLEGGGTVPADFLCAGRMVRIPIDQNIPDPLTAQEVYVEEDSGAGVVASIESASRTLVLNTGRRVIVPADAMILDSRGDQQLEVGFGDIAIGDYVFFFGLQYCGGTDFYAPMVTITELP